MNRLLRLHPRYLACLALGGVWLLFFAEAILTSKVLVARDLLMTEIPLRVYLRERLVAGQFPGWFPYEMLGVPFAGTVIASAFHPRTLLFLLFDAAVSTKWSLLLAYLVGLSGAYRLARQFQASRVGAVAGAIVFALSGCAISYSNKTNMLLGMMTAPWMLAAVWRLTKRDDLRDVISLAIWWALIFLGGEPQMFLEVALVAGGLLIAGGLRQRAVFRCALAGILASALAGAELMPSLGVGDDSIRAYWTIKPILAKMWALHPMRLGEFLLPRFIPDEVRLRMGEILETRKDFFVEWVYVGGAALTLAAIGLAQQRRGRLVWVFTALLGLWLSTGAYGGIIEEWWTVAPFFAKFRYPEKYVGIVMIALVPLVAWGVDAVVRESKRFSPVLMGIGIAFVLLGVLMPAERMANGWMHLTGVSPMPEEAVSRILVQAWSTGFLRVGAAILGLGGVVWAIARDRRALLGVPAVVFLEIWSGNSGHIPLVSHALATEQGEIARILAAEQRPGEPPPRVIPATLSFDDTNIPDAERVRLGHLSMQADDSTRAKVGVMEVNDPGEQWRVMRTFYGKKKVNWEEWMARLGVCYRVASDAAPPAPNETPISPVFDQGMTLVRRDCMNRAYFAKAERVEDAEAAQARMREGLPADTVVWEDGPPLDDPDGTVEWVTAEPEYLKLNVSAQKPSALVVSETYATGWVAFLDGNPTPIYATNAAARGFAIPPGKHVLEMEYRAPWQTTGIVLSLMGILGCFGVARAARRERRLGLSTAVVEDLPFTWDGLETRVRQFAPRDRATLALVAAWATFFSSVIFTSRVLFERDLMLTEMPLRQYMAERLASGELPQWFPYEILGLPFSGSLVASPFHPQVLLHLVFSVAVATKWRILLAYLFGLAGMYRLIRLFGGSRIASVGGAWAFAFSGYAISVNNDIPFLMPMCTAPWLYASFWRMTRRENPRDVAAAGIWWALIATGGDAQLFVESGLIGLGLLYAGSSVTVAQLKAFAQAPKFDAPFWRWPGIVRTSFARFTGSAVIASLLCAAEVLPGFLLRNENERAAWKETRTLAKQWAIHPYRYLDLFIPRFTPDRWREEAGWLIGKRIDYFAFTVFIGAAVAVLILVGISANLRKRTWALGAAATAVVTFGLSLYARGMPLSFAGIQTDYATILRFISIASFVVGLVVSVERTPQTRLLLAIGLSLLFSFWLSTGYFGGLLMPFWKVAIPFAKFRYPEKYLAVFGVMLGPMVAWGIDAAKTHGQRIAQGAVAVGVAVLALNSLVSSETIVKTWMQWTSVPINPKREVSPELIAGLAESWSPGMTQTGIAFIAIGAVLMAIHRERRLLVLLPLVLFVDLAMGNTGRMPLVSREVAEDVGLLEHQLLTLQRPRQPPVRVFSARPDISVDLLPSDERVAKTHLFSYSNDGARGHVAPFDINSPSEEWRVLHTFFGNMAPAVGDWIPRFNVCYRIATPGGPPTQDETPVPGMETEGFQVVKHECQSRAYLASAIAVPATGDDEADFRAAADIMRPGLPRNLVVWEGGPQVEGGGGSVHWVSAEPERQEFEVVAQAQSAFVVSDAYALGWTATIDGVPTRIYPTNGAARGVLVPEGKHEIVMTYNAPGLKLGLWMGALGLAICLGLLLLSRRPEFQRATA